MPYRGLKKVLFGAYVAFEEWALRHMTTRSLTFANGAALREKHEKHQKHGAKVIETKTTTLSLADIASRTDTCGGGQIKCLTVSRIDPRKGLRALPGAIALLVGQGRDVTIDIVGPTIGQIGVSERDAIAAEARRLGVEGRVRLLGPIPLDQLMPLYQQYDVFVLPTQPGEGIPRVLMEAMAAGLPVITTDVAGIASLIEHERNGLLVSLSASSVSSAAPGSLSSAAVALALSAALIRVIEDFALRRRLISGGYQTARAHTLENQAAEMMRVVSSELQLA